MPSYFNSIEKGKIMSTTQNLKIKYHQKHKKIFLFFYQINYFIGRYSKPCNFGKE